MIDRPERWRLLLTLIRDTFCNGNQAELARRIEKDGSYVNRLLWRPDKKGAKGIGPEVIEACNRAFRLPPGYWDMAPAEARAVLEVAVTSAQEAKTVEPVVAAPQVSGDEVVIAQYDISGGMDTRGRLIVEGGQPGVIQSWSVSLEWLRLNVPTYTSLQNLSIVTGFGPSMKGMYNPGDPLLMDRGVNVVNHDGVYFFRVGDEGYIKILQRVPEFDGSGYRLRVISKNEEYPPYDLSPRNPHLIIIGKILTVWKSEQY